MSGRPGLTTRQAAVLQAIGQLTVGEVGPCLKELADAIGVRSLSTVHKHVEQLRAKGYVETQWNRTRSIRVAAPPASSPDFAAGFREGWRAALARAATTTRPDLLSEMDCAMALRHARPEA